jgi:hypothetical protein
MLRSEVNRAGNDHEPPKPEKGTRIEPEVWVGQCHLFITPSQRDLPISNAEMSKAQNKETKNESYVRLRFAHVPAAKIFEKQGAIMRSLGEI